MGGSSKKVTVGYRYSMGLHMGLCHEPDALLEIRAGDRRAWSGVITENTTTTIYAPNLFGGDEREGGILGTMDVMMGRPDQAPNAYLAEHQGTPQPAYRGFLGLVYRGLIASNNPYIKNWAARVRSILRGWHGGEAWYPERAAIGMVAPQAAAIYMALDYSFSMEQPVPGGGTRMTNMKAAVTATLEMLKTNIVDTGGVLHLRIERFGESATGAVWMNATAVDIEAAKAYVNGSTYLSGTSFAAAMGQLSAFYSAAAGQRIGVLVTDGEPNGLDADAQAARVLVNAISGLRMYGINIDLADTTYTEMVNNTGAPVPVVAGDDPSALAAALADAILGGRIGMNPAHIIVQALTDPDWGMGYPMATIDQASFRAAANALYAEGLGLSFKWNTQSTIQEFTQIVADHASLVYGQDRRTGLFRMRLLRHDYNVDDLPVFTRHDVKVIRYQRPSLADTVNEVIIQYTDALTGKDASTAPMQNLANIQGQGRVVSQTLNFPGIQTPQLAARVGMRELQARSTALWRFSLEAKRRFANLLPGEPFVLDLLDTDIGVRLVMRAGEIDYGEAADAVVRAECVEDVFAMPDTTYAGNPGSGGEVPDTSAKPGPAQVFEVPYTELVQTVPAAELSAIPPDAGYVGAVALRPPGVPLNYALFTRLGAAEFDEAATGDYAPGAILAAPVSDAADDVSLVVASGTRLQELAIGSGAFLGEGPGAEIVRIDAVDLEAGTITVGRGCADTIPREWPPGTRLWGFDVEATADPQQYVDGETVDAKVVNRSTNGQIELADAAGGSVTIASRQARPYPPHQLKVNGEAEPEEPVRLSFDLSWVHRDRVLQADTLVDATEASIGPEPGTTYTVRMYLDDTLVDTIDGVAGDTAAGISYPGNGEMRLEVAAVRDGLESWQVPSIAFDYSGALTLSGELPQGLTGVPYTGSITASGGVPPYTWSLGAGAPAEWTIDPDTGVITGTATTPGAYAFDVIVEDAEANIATSPQSVTLVQGDDHWSKVQLLTHFDGTPGDTAFPDEKGAVWTGVGSSAPPPSLSDEKVKFGATSMRLDLPVANANAYIATPKGTATRFDTTKDYTAEAWVCPAVAKRHTVLFIHETTQDNLRGGMSLYVLANGTIQVNLGTEAGWVVMTTPTVGQVALNQWSHLAVTRQGDVVRVFINGALGASHTLTGPTRNPGNGTPLEVGRDVTSADRGYNGWIDELRWTQGVARYTAAFTPPTAPFPNGGL